MQPALFVIAWLLCGICCALIAPSKRRSVAACLMAGVLLGPIGLVAVAISPTHPDGDQSPAAAIDDDAAPPPMIGRWL